MREVSQGADSGSASPRFQERANFLIVTGIARAADLQSLTVFELKLPAAGVRGGADTATFAEQLRDFGGVLLHVAAADKARQHGNITSDLPKSRGQTSGQRLPYG